MKFNWYDHKGRRFTNPATIFDQFKIKPVEVLPSGELLITGRVGNLRTNDVSVTLTLSEILELLPRMLAAEKEKHNKELTTANARADANLSSYRLLRRLRTRKDTPFTIEDKRTA